jgi:hypothetical protein
MPSFYSRYNSCKPDPKPESEVRSTHSTQKSMFDETVISGRGFLGLPQSGLSNHNQPRSCRRLSEPSANSSLTVAGEGGWDVEQPYLYKGVLLHIFVGDITGIL